MEIKMSTCPNGHSFNADIYARCPECGAAPVEGGQSYGGGAFPKTTDPSQASGGYGGGAFPKTTDPSQASAGYGGGAFPKTTDPSQASGGYGGGEFPKTTAPGAAMGATTPVDGRSGGFATPFSVPTQAAVDLRHGSGSEPVVGWLVCIEGPMRGQDFRIHDGYNFIGREEGDIRIKGDNAISRQKHAVVAFYSKRNTFHVGPAEGRNIIELNDEPVFNHVQVENYDVITVGNTKLMLVGLCGDRFNWTDGVKHE